MSAALESGIILTLAIGDAEPVVVAVAGELDAATASDFAAVLNALIDRGHQRVTIDCRDLDFIAASGIGVLAAAYARLRRTDGEIRVQGVSDLAYRILEITQMLDVLHVERRNPYSRPTFNADETDPITRHAAGLAADSARSDAIANTLDRMMALIPEIITGCDGATVTLRRADRLVTPSASNDTVRDLDLLQYADRQGPCVDAANSGVQTHAAALVDEQRWPTFTAQARERGIESILSSPLIIDDQTVGALNLYARAPDAFFATDQDLATVFAHQTALLLIEPDLTTTGGFDDRIRDALISRDIIAQAQGVLMERLHIDADAATVTLRRDSVRTSIPLRIQADRIVAETVNPRVLPDTDETADA